MSEFFDSIRITLGATVVTTILRAILIFVICCVAIRIIKALLKKVLLKTNLDATLEGFVLTAANVVLWVLAIIIVATTLGIDTATLVAAVSVVGLALSLAVQNIMANLFSGLTLLFTRPFKAGDYVAAAGNEGTIQSIGLFYTVIKTPDNKVISIPNGDVTAASIINYSTEDTRRIAFTFSASYDCPTEKVRTALLEAAAADSRILPDPAPVVYLSEYKDSCIDYSLRIWVKNDDYWDVYFKMNESVRESFERNGIEMTYNHLNVHIIEK
ncbi:MAG: mechanosensitive ion channel family protein [Oscillospiraceae bacterium]|nr:mechanosensitive ion channel family protein [Oscillospiraceae bacterium]